MELVQNEIEIHLFPEVANICMTYISLKGFRLECGQPCSHLLKCVSHLDYIENVYKINMIGTVLGFFDKVPVFEMDEDREIWDYLIKNIGLVISKPHILTTQDYGHYDFQIQIFINPKLKRVKLKIMKVREDFFERMMQRIMQSELFTVEIKPWKSLGLLQLYEQKKTFNIEYFEKDGKLDCRVNKLKKIK
jgi:hypothetical protein